MGDQAVFSKDIFTAVLYHSGLNEIPRDRKVLVLALDFAGAAYPAIRNFCSLGGDLRQIWNHRIAYGVDDCIDTLLLASFVDVAPFTQGKLLVIDREVLGQYTEQRIRPRMSVTEWDMAVAAGAIFAEKVNEYGKMNWLEAHEHEYIRKNINVMEDELGSDVGGEA